MSLSPSLTLAWQNLLHWQLMEGREDVARVLERPGIEDEKKLAVMFHILRIRWSHLPWSHF